MDDPNRVAQKAKYLTTIEEAYKTACVKLKIINAKIKEGDLMLSDNLPDLLQQTSLLLLEEMQKQQQAQQQAQQEQQNVRNQQEEQAAQGAGQGEAGAPPNTEGRPQMEPAI